MWMIEYRENAQNHNFNHQVICGEHNHKTVNVPNYYAFIWSCYRCAIMTYRKRPFDYEQRSPDAKRGRFMSIYDCINLTNKLDAFKSAELTPIAPEALILDNREKSSPRERLSLVTAVRSSNVPLPPTIPACSFCQRTHEPPPPAKQRTLDHYFCLDRPPQTPRACSSPIEDTEMSSLRPIALMTCVGCGEQLCSRCASSELFSLGSATECFCFDCACGHGGAM